MTTYFFSCANAASEGGKSRYPKVYPLGLATLWRIRACAFTSGDRRYSLSLVDGFFGGGENFAENGSWAVVCSMG